MNVASIVSMIAPARAADSASPSAKGGFAALLSGQEQPGGFAASDQALPELASAAGRLKQGELAPQAALPLDIQSMKPGENEPRAGNETPEEGVPVAVFAGYAVAEPVAAENDAPAPSRSNLQQPEAQVDTQPVAPSITATIAPAPASLVGLGAQTAVSASDVPPVKGIKGNKGDRAEKADQPSGATDQSGLAEAMLSAIPVQDQSATTKPTVAMAAATLVAPQPGVRLQGEVLSTPDAQGSKRVDSGPATALTSGASQPGAGFARQEAAGPVDRLMDGAVAAANSGDANLTAPMSRPVAFSDVYATRQQPVSSPAIAAQVGTMGREMGVEIARHVTAGRSEMLVRLNPPEMGRIEVRLSFDHDGGLRAVMSADNHGALDLLRRETGDLTRALTDAGVKADAQSFRFDSRGGEAGQRGQPQQQHQPGQHGREAANIRNGIADEQPLYRALRVSGHVDLMA